jgi:uncharacterized linocin/CFP29 family protein
LDADERVSHLLREHPPITEASWSLSENEAHERLTPAAARTLVDFAGPHGWEHSATNLGRTAALADAPVEDLEAAQRHVLAVVGCAPFSLARAELRDADRGAQDVDLAALAQAGHRMATAENRAVSGWQIAGIAGIGHRGHRGHRGRRGHRRPRRTTRSRGEQCELYPRHVAQAVEALLRTGVGGPYGLARRSPSPASSKPPSTGLDHLRKIIGGALVWAPVSKARSC